MEEAKNGVLSKSGRNVSFLIIHERAFTRERGFRLSPRKYDSPLCLVCGLVETITHKYATCMRVAEAWERLKDILQDLEQDFIFETDHSIINMYFKRMTRENAVIWLLGKYLELLEKEVLLNGRLLTSKILDSWLSCQL